MTEGSRLLHEQPRLVSQTTEGCSQYSTHSLITNYTAQSNDVGRSHDLGRSDSTIRSNTTNQSNATTQSNLMTLSDHSTQSDVNSARSENSEDSQHRQIQPSDQHHQEHHTPLHQRRPADRNNVGTALLAHASHSNGSEYGAVPQHGLLRTAHSGTGRDQQQQPGAVDRPGSRQSLLRTGEHHHLGAGSDRTRKGVVIATGDRKNEFFTLKRYIFMTLGMPGTPAITSRLQRISSKQ